MSTLQLRSYAKINLGLQIIGRRSDGYHNIVTIFQQIGLCDELAIGVREGEPCITCNDSAVPTDERNLCWRAASLLKRSTGMGSGFHLDIKKNIPVGAGLGGGSSNAAVVLIALNELWEVHLTFGELQELAKSIGADVTFFLRGGAALGEGKGDILSAIEIPGQYWCVLVSPDINISTRWAYERVKFDLTNKDKNVKFTRLGNLGNNTLEWKDYLDNDFERIVFPLYPKLQSIKSQLNELGCFFCSLSGSGSSVFGLFKDKYAAQRAQSFFAAECQSYVVRPIHYGYEEIREVIFKQST